MRIGSDEETDSERYPDPILSVDEGSGDPIANEQANALMGLTPAFLKAYEELGRDASQILWN